MTVKTVSEATDVAFRPLHACRVDDNTGVNNGKLAHMLACKD